jgi:glycogen debranching enzyme
MLKKFVDFIVNFTTNPFAGLPELTNENGSFCKDSCKTQAWSSAVLLELLDELKLWEHNK